MKTFWALILVLILAAGALLFFEGRTPQPARELTPAPRVDAPSAAPPLAAPGPAPSASIAQPPPPPPTAPASADVFPLATDPPRPPQAQAHAPGAHALGSAPAPAPGWSVIVDPLQAPLLGAGPADARLAVSGAGTAEDPYIVSWGVLLSAQETFKPKLGKKEIPDRVKELDGKRVRITGFLAFPFMSSQASELLVMQNMWDGCCIGVPPTPYDAIEVLLATPAEGALRFMQYGAVEGTLKVDPFVRGDWLISLYTMSDARLTPEM